MLCSYPPFIRLLLCSYRSQGNSRIGEVLTVTLSLPLHESQIYEIP